jgi:CRP-like cAMP-binding protein/rhodanese-related sulfurtransferase
MSRDEVPLSLLAQFSPLEGLKRENLKALARKAVVETRPAGEWLFRQTDREKRTFYLIRGDIELLSAEKRVRTIRGGSEEAKHPLAPVLPRRVAARTLTPCECLVLDSDLLDVMLTWDQTGSYEVSDLRGSTTPETDDWMTALLQNKSFHRIPPANLQAVFMRMQRVTCKAGEVVIKQGQEGDYFYVITDGRCLVTRETPLSRDGGIKLAELRVGDTFGEEALISGAKRNATVTMITDGALMRLGKDDFNSLLNEPMLSWVDYAKATALVAQGGAWLDVRLPSEYNHGHIEDAMNIPLYFIRLKLKSLKKDTKYVVYCDTGRRSSAAAYILSERGYDAYVLTGGLASRG